jgi:hypothetical protein
VYRKPLSKFIQLSNIAEENVFERVASAAGNFAVDAVTRVANTFSVPSSNNKSTIYNSILKIEKDMDFLDDLAGKTPQLKGIELAVLGSTVLASSLAPFIFGIKFVELLVPSMAAISAAVGISAEYAGKVAVAKGKEVSALAIQAAAESEVILAQAEKSKAVLPMCVGIATTASAFALLAPTFIDEMSKKSGFTPSSECYFISPLVAVLSAAIAGLACQESNSLSSRAIGIGNRRFASSSGVGRTWLSATEQVELSTERLLGKWNSFAYGVLPAPILAFFIPGSIAFKGIVCAAIAAAQAAYYLSSAEFYLAAAVDAVSLKTRAAAIADTYANQGNRAGAVLPLTSALAGLCAAASAAAVELIPLIHAPQLQSLLALIFPAGASLFAAAASVAKARCEVLRVSHNYIFYATFSMFTFMFSFDVARLTLLPPQWSWRHV